MDEREKLVWAALRARHPDLEEPVQAADPKKIQAALWHEVEEAKAEIRRCHEADFDPTLNFEQKVAAAKALLRAEGRLAALQDATLIVFPPGP